MVGWVSGSDPEGGWLAKDVTLAIVTPRRGGVKKASFLGDHGMPHPIVSFLDLTIRPQHDSDTGEISPQPDPDDTCARHGMKTCHSASVQTPKSRSRAVVARRTRVRDSASIKEYLAAVTTALSQLAAQEYSNTGNGKHNALAKDVSSGLGSFITGLLQYTRRLAVTCGIASCPGEVKPGRSNKLMW